MVLCTNKMTIQWDILPPTSSYETATVPNSNPPIIIDGRSHSDKGDVCKSDIFMM